MGVFALDPIRGSTRSELPKLGNSTIRLANLFKEAEGMGLLSFFGSAQVNFKMLRRKTFSIATTEMRQLPTIVTAIGVELATKSRPEQGAVTRLPIFPNHSAVIPDPSYSSELMAFSKPEDLVQPSS
jgi:hypothetical protein